MSLSDALLPFLARRFRIPPAAVRMFRAASRSSGLDRSTLPVELLPLNTIQMSRGLLNFTVLQTLEHWVLPYWAERQYDPTSPEFIPRSHLGLSMNVTNRNWTAAGSPECAIEPIVDPRGAVTLRPDAWSIDFWLGSGTAVIFPSRSMDVRQSLHENLPIVRTVATVEDLVMTSTVYTVNGTTAIRIGVANSGRAWRGARLGVAIRPFNPEGVALIEEIRADASGRGIAIDGTLGITVDTPPSRLLMSNRAAGDVAWRFAEETQGGDDREITCASGLATAVMIFDLSLGPGEAKEVTLRCPLDSPGTPEVEPLTAVVEKWKDLLGRGAVCQLPDRRIGDLFEASKSALLASLDATSICPGPATYHYFWFRDAAYMLLALDRLGYGTMTRGVIERFPEGQERSGMFRSQQGEWDSTGQAIWSVWNHAVFAHDPSLAERLFPSLVKGIGWIEAKRMHAPGDPLLDGLLPRGLSAEHLGLADVYYWDSFWSLAGVEAFERICAMLGKGDERDRAHRLAVSLRRAIGCSINAARAHIGTSAIPAGPLRSIDAGIIGTVAAWYPLQLFPPDDTGMRATLKTIRERMFRQGMFYQPFIHSGLNVYLTLQVAEALLYAGDAGTFWAIVSGVAGRSSPTFTYPEAIHPMTGGGCMGDGHHGWAAAEVVLAMRNAFVMEVWELLQGEHTIRFLGGIPATWFDQSEQFALEGAPIPEGRVDIRVRPHGEEALVDIVFHPGGVVPAGRWMLSLPACWSSVMCDDREIEGQATRSERWEAPIPARSTKIVLRRNARPRSG